MKSCETCAKCKGCTRATGMIAGGCSVEYESDTEKIYKQLDNLEGCEDNPVYTKQIKELRALL